MLQLRPTFSESWYRVANLKVRLRPSCQISRQYYRGDRWYVVRDPAGNQYHRLSDPAYRFVALLDGSRTINEAWELVGGVMDDEAPTQPEVIQILSQLYAANLIEADVTPDSSVLLKRHRNLMKRKFQQRLMNVLFPRIPIWDPDNFLKRWGPILNPLMSWPAAVIWLIVVGYGLFTVAPMGTELTQAARDSIAPSNWIALWAVFVFTKFIHEMGHAASTRRFGGECHEMGVMFLVFIPTPYVDASAAWSFPSRWARMFVGAAGMIVEIFFAAICAVIWANTSSGQLIHQLAYNAMLIASVSTVLFNANPLLRYDGYYMLSDFLEIPNLQKRSSDYFMGLLKRHVFRVKAKEPLPNFTTRFWLFVYAVTSTVYRVFIGLVIIVLVAFQVPILGILMSLGGLITWIGMPIFKSIKYLALDPELHRKRGKAWAWSAGMLAAAALFLGVIPFPFRVMAEGVVEPSERSLVHAMASGFVDQVHVQDGQSVKAGQVLITLRDDALAAEVKRVSAVLEATRTRYKTALNVNATQAEFHRQEVRVYEEELAKLQNRAAKLEIKADIEGEVVAPALRDLPGSYVSQGQQVVFIASSKSYVVRTVVHQEDAELIPADGKAPTLVRLAGYVVQTLPADHVEVVNAASKSVPSAALTHAGGGDLQPDSQDPKGTTAATQQIPLRVYLSPETKLTKETGEMTPNAELIAGQRAYVRMELGSRTIASQAWRRFLQVIQSHSNGKWI